MSGLLNHIGCGLQFVPSWQQGKWQLLNPASGDEATVDAGGKLKFNQAGWAKLVYDGNPEGSKWVKDILKVGVMKHDGTQRLFCNYGGDIGTQYVDTLQKSIKARHFPVQGSGLQDWCWFTSLPVQGQKLWWDVRHFQDFEQQQRDKCKETDHYRMQLDKFKVDKKRSRPAESAPLAKPLPKKITVSTYAPFLPPRCSFYDDEQNQRLRCFLRTSSTANRISTGLSYSPPSSVAAAVAHCFKWAWETYTFITKEKCPYDMPE